MAAARVDRLGTAAGAAALVAAAWAVGVRAVPVPAAMPAVLVPALFVIAGLLGPVWRAARFTCRGLIAVGGLHLAGLAASAAAQLHGDASPEWHALSLLLFSAGFAALLPLTAGYPAGPAPRASLVVAAACCLLPLAAAFAGPTPVVLAGGRGTATLGPVAPLLPDWVGDAAAAVFLLPVAAVAVAVVRAVRGGREVRGRLLLPLIALGAFALLLAVGAVVPAPVETALVLVSSPLVPAGLVAGARPLTAPLDARAAPAVPVGALGALSPREREVLAAMADGRTNALIARELHMSLSAVEKHTTAIFTKLGLPPDAATHRRVAAVVAYLRAAR